MNILRSLLLSLLAKKRYQKLKPSDWGFVDFHFSQYGEDIALDYFPEFHKENGFFVDVGAFHPQFYSNTYRLYLQKGWRGINIDASKKSIALCEKHRPHDISIHTGVSNQEGEFPFYESQKGVCSSFLPGDPGSSVKQTTSVVRTQPLSKILDQYLPENQHIDILSVDCEGLDLEVLKSNNWGKYRPTLLMVEDHGHEAETETVSYCRSIGYGFVNWAGPTKFFMKS